MNGLVLLDERQQRELYRATSTVSTPSQPGYRSTTSSNEAGRLQRGRGSIVSSQGSEPRTDFRSRGNAPVSPRTDFTSTGNGRFGGASPRTDFTTRASPNVDFAHDEGLPRTDFTSGKPSVSTYLTTSSTEPTHRDRYDILGNPTADSYPMLRHSDSESSTDADSAQPNRYAGASSGLKISVTYIMIGVVVGVALGILLSHFEVSALAAQWVSLPGDLFLRALKCLVVPYVFCSVAVAIGDIVFVGKVSVVGLQTAKVFFIFWLATVTMGVGVGLLFRPLFQRDTDATAASTDKVVGFLCPNNQTVAMLANESIACRDTASVSSSPASLFTILDVNNVVKVNTKNQIAELSLGDQIMGMITPIVSSNIIASMANSELLSIITFAMVLGSIAGRSYFTKSRRINYLYLVLLQLRNAFFLAMEWTIWLTPVAVVSIIAGTFATNQSALRQSGNVYVYVAAVVAAALLQVLVLFPAIVFFMTRCNPYNHMRGMVRAYMFAFACSSSLATAPVTLTCVKKARVCSQSLANFVISIGVTSNLSAVGFYFPIAVIFLAESSGNGDKINALHVVGIFVLSLLSCAGTPPIPAAGLVTISTIYSTVFGVSEMPSTFVYVAAVDFLVDRFATVCNVNDDIMALKVIAENTDETVTQDQLGERF